MDASLSPTELKRLHRTWRKSTEGRIGMIVDGVQQPYNVGGLIRSHAAYGGGPFWLVPPSPGPDHPKVSVTAKGCERFLEMRSAPRGTDAVAEAQADGFTVVAVELTKSAQALFELDLTGDVCLIVGHEERGVHKETLAACDHVGFLPLAGRVGSLNAAHAGTAALAEVLRQHVTASPT